MCLRRVIIATLFIFSCICAYGQEDLHDYRYYKLFEDAYSLGEQPMLPTEQTDSIQTKIPLRRPDTGLFDYRLSFVRFLRRGMEYSERMTRLDGIRVDHLSQTMAERLQMGCSRADGILFSSDYVGSMAANIDYSSNRTLIPRTSVATTFSSRDYLAGANVSTAQSLGRGWSLATDVVARTGRDLHIRSLFSNSVSLGLSVVKQIDSLNTLSLTLLASPSERATRSYATREAFSLVGDHLYNPSWGRQSGKIRNSRIRREAMPTAIFCYRGRWSERTSAELSLGTTIGISRFSTLEWYDAQTPMPDNYRYMPSYSTDQSASSIIADEWLCCNKRYTQIDFDELYATNRLSGRSIYALADRVERRTRLQTRLALATQASKRTTILYGVDVEFDRCRRYKELRDDLGGGGMADLDYYIVDDDTFSSLKQNDMNHPDRHVGKGSRFGYDYALSRWQASAFALVRYATEQLRVEAGIESGYSSANRRGYYRKELFADNSFGRSARTTLSPYRLRMTASYRIAERHLFEAGLYFSGEMPDVDDIFLQAEYNNRRIDSPQIDKRIAAEVSYTLDLRSLRLRTTLFATRLFDQTQVSHLYDDISSTYADVVASHIGRLNYGIEIDLAWRMADHWRLAMATSFGRYEYRGDARLSIYDDRDNTLICDCIRSHIDGYAVGGAPQIATALSLSYFNRGWGANVGANYAGFRYVTPSLMRRTERVAYLAPSPEGLTEMVRQERLPDALTLDVSLSKTFRFGKSDKRIYRPIVAERFTDRHPHSRITLFFAVHNLLGNRNIIYGGYESSRMMHHRVADGTLYSPHPSRYLYAYPRTYNFAVRFTF